MRLYLQVSLPTVRCPGPNACLPTCLSACLLKLCCLGAKRMQNFPYQYFAKLQPSNPSIKLGCGCTALAASSYFFKVSQYIVHALHIHLPILVSDKLSNHIWEFVVGLLFCCSSWRAVAHAESLQFCKWQELHKHACSSPTAVTGARAA